MKKLNIEICMGTTCFVMGASNLQDLADLVGAKYRGLVSVENRTCLGLCSQNNYNKAPYVKVGSEVVSDATVEKVLEAIERQTNEK